MKDYNTKTFWGKIMFSWTNNVKELTKVNNKLVERKHAILSCHTHNSYKKFTHKINVILLGTWRTDIGIEKKNSNFVLIKLSSMSANTYDILYLCCMN